MEDGLLITCPEHDLTTAYLVYFSKEVIEMAEKKPLKCKKVMDKDLHLKGFSEILQNLNFKFIVLNGHGSPHTIYGYKENPIIEMGENDHLLKERLVYARSCDAGQELGKECMKNTKEGCFIGYCLPFVFYMDSKWTAKPGNDNVAKLFLEPSNTIPISIIKGNTTGKAHENAKKQTVKIIEKLMESQLKEQETPFYIEALWNNYLGQVIHGNSEAKL